jgi:uncharacterized BrkB/YihY/UPF0761 family membrane protein
MFTFIQNFQFNFESVIMEIKKNRKRILKKTLIIIFSILITLVLIIILFASLITKYLVEKYDYKYTGREITMDWAYTNPLPVMFISATLKFMNKKAC